MMGETFIVCGAGDDVTEMTSHDRDAGTDLVAGADTMARGFDARGAHGPGNATGGDIAARNAVADADRPRRYRGATGKRISDCKAILVGHFVGRPGAALICGIRVE